MAKGRKKGSVGCLYVTLAELNERLKPSQRVLVSKRFLDMLEMSGTSPSAPATPITKTTPFKVSVKNYE
jgi:hypothetical protein